MKGKRLFLCQDNRTVSHRVKLLKVQGCLAQQQVGGLRPKDFDRSDGRIAMGGYTEFLYDEPFTLAVGHA